MGFADSFQISFFCEGHSRVCNPLSRTLANAIYPFFGPRHYALRLIAEVQCHVLVSPLHLFVREPHLFLARVVGGDLRSGCSPLILHRQMRFDLFPPRTRSVQILAAVTLDFWLTALAVFDLIAQLLQMVCQFRAVHGSGVLLSAIKFLRLQRAGFAIFRFCQIEEDHVSVKLRGCITVYRPGAIVLEFRGNPVARCLWCKIPSKPGLDISFHLVQRDSDTGPMSFLHALTAFHKCRQRYAFRRRKGRISARAVRHRLDCFAVLVHIFPRRLIANQLLAGSGMLAIAEAPILFLLHATTQSPFLGQLSVPLAPYAVAFAVVVLLRVAELLLMIGTGLTCTERLGNSKHVVLFEKASLGRCHGMFQLLVPTRRRLLWWR